MEDRLHRAQQLYERAVFDGDEAAPGEALSGLDGLEADLALARGKILHARFLATQREEPEELALLERAAELHRGLGDRRGEGEAQLWLGIFHQVVRDDVDVALPFLRRAEELARAAGDDLTLSYAVRHLGFADAMAGRTDAARARLEESVELRRGLAFPAGVAAGVLALAELEARTGDREHALRLAEEARTVARAVGAAGVERWVDVFRAQRGS